MRNSHRILKFVVFILATHSSWAQQQGNIRGTVVDQSTKQPLAGANVQIMGTELGCSTNAEGVFVINNLPEDVYKIKVSYLGYFSRLETDVRVIRNKTTSIQEIGLVETTLEGSEVIVTPGLQAEIETMPVSSTVFSREEIRRTAGTGGDVLRAASVLPGVSTTAGEFSTFSVRGGGPRDNLILIDNIPFDKISHFEGGSSEQEVQGGRFSVFSSGLIEKVTFSAGGYGPEYGRKSASVMDLTMKEGNLKTATMDAAFDPGGAEINYDGPSLIHDNTSVVFNARYYDYSRLLEAMDMAKLFYPAFGDVILKTTTEINPGNRISVLGIYSKDDLYRDRKNLFAADDLVENDIWDIKETRSILGVNWRMLTGSQSVLHNTFYYRGNERRRSAGNAWGPSGTVLPLSQNDISLRRDIIKQNQDELEIGWKSDFTQVLGNNATLNAGVELFSIGLDYQTTQNGNDTIYTFDRRDPRPDPALYYLVTTPEMTANHFDNHTEQLGAYLAPSFKIGERFSLSPGLRVEWNGLNDQNTFSPRVQAKFHLNPRTVVNASAGVYYQNPLYGDITASPENVRLKNERALHAIVGVSRQFGEDIKVTIEAYYKQFDDLIVRADHSSMAMKNQGAGWSRGIDFLVQKRFTGNCYAQMTYSYSASKRNDGDGLGEYNAPYSQPHIFNLLGGYQVNKKLFVSAKLHCATGRPKHKYIVHENVFNDPNLIRYSQEITDRFADRLTPFIMLDARIDYRLQLGRLALVSFLDLTNILNRYNATEDRFSELSGKEKPLGFGFIPTIGFKLEL